MRLKIYRYIKEYIDNCLTCLVSNVAPNAHEGEIQKVDPPSEPGQEWYMDHFGPLTKFPDGFKYILVIVDAFTRFTWLFPTKTTKSKEVIKSLKMLLKTLGKPDKVVSDRGTAFIS